MYRRSPSKLAKVLSLAKKLGLTYLGTETGLTLGSMAAMRGRNLKDRFKMALALHEYAPGNIYRRLGQLGGWGAGGYAILKGKRPFTRALLGSLAASGVTGSLLKMDPKAMALLDDIVKRSNFVFF